MFSTSFEFIDALLELETLSWLLFKRTRAFALDRVTPFNQKDRKWIKKAGSESIINKITSLCIWFQHLGLENKTSCENIFIILIAANLISNLINIVETASFGWLSRYRIFTSYQEKTFQNSVPFLIRNFVESTEKMIFRNHGLLRNQI